MSYTSAPWRERRAACAIGGRCRAYLALVVGGGIALRTVAMRLTVSSWRRSRNRILVSLALFSYSYLPLKKSGLALG
ncbi:hypothetical protein [Streptomyces sp. NPDC002133]|uniref:hypothetical protein n=1 Tax=Streptomyces sp. NPDC002133 TaxID=3154409 RepID=UPI0033257E94